MIQWLIACAVFILTSMAVFAEPDTGDLFALCSSAEGMRLVVESLREHAVQGGLTEQSIRNATESRLRAAGIYDSKATPYLYVNVNVGRPEKGDKHFPYYSIGVEYKRVLLDDRVLGLGYRVFDSDWGDQLYGFATTWDSGGSGQGDNSYILSNLSQLLDEFLVDYLRVRDSKACQDLRKTPGVRMKGTISPRLSDVTTDQTNANRYHFTPSDGRPISPSQPGLPAA